LVLTDEQWAVLEPIVEACRPHAKVPPRELRRTVSAILWRHANGATKWRAIPEELGPWWMAAQTVGSMLPTRWSRLGVWERMLAMAQERGVALGMAFLDGTAVRAHHKAAGAAKKAQHRRSGTRVRRLAALAAATAPRPS
jgi:transposase